MILLQIIIGLNLLYMLGTIISDAHNSSVNKKQFTKFQKNIVLMDEDHQKMMDESDYNVYREEWYSEYSDDYFDLRSFNYYSSYKNYKELNLRIETFINWYRDKSPMFKGAQIRRRRNMNLEQLLN